MGLHQKTKLKVGGLVPFTATDYPGKLAAVIFVQGCPWRCGYCHNPHLQERTADSPIAWDTIMDFLHKRRGLIDAVVFSGGEPAMDPGIVNAIQDVRSLDYSIGLHTGGTHPRRIAQILPAIDWLGLDIKTNFANYMTVTKVKNSGIPANETLKLVLAGHKNFECRTTIHPDLINQESLLDLAHELAKRGVRNYAVQVFRPQGCADQGLNSVNIHNWPEPNIIQQIEKLFDSFSLRRD